MNRWLVAVLTLIITIQGFSQTNLMDVKPWAYWLQTIDIPTIVNDTSFELIVMDYSADGQDNEKWTTEEVAAVKNSGKYAISYISIGEAEDYRYYWQPSWSTSPPSWLGPENPDWPGNFAVRYWEPQWQSIVYDYLDTILMQGFDGIYMDLIDAYYYWSEVNPEQPLADSLMCQFVIDIRNYCDLTRGDNDFIILPQNGEDVWDQENVSLALKTEYFNAINGIGVEDVFFPGPLDEDNIYDPDLYRIGILQEYLLNNKQVYAIDYLTDTVKISQFINATTAQNFIPYVCTRPLEYLCGGITLGLSELEPISSGNISIYPNPANNYLKISLNKCDFGNHPILRIHNSIGQVVKEYSITMNDGNIITLDLSDYHNGLYYLIISDGEKVVSCKLVVSR